MNPLLSGEYATTIGILVARVTLGVMFLYSGYDKAIRIGTKNVALEFQRQLNKYSFPPFLFTLTAIYSAWVELIGGVLLIAGLLKFVTLSALGIDLLLVSIAFSLLDPIWDMKHVFPRLLLLLLLLFIPLQQDVCSLDYMLFFKS